MIAEGYYRFPAISGDTIVFVCEDDLWTVPAAGGVARRLTAGVAEVTNPHISPDGQWVAFTGREEGTPEVYVMPAQGGPARRLTFLGTGTLAAGWHPEGRDVIFASCAGQPFVGLMKLWRVDHGGGIPERLPFGPALSISFGPQGRVVVGRHTRDPARWKRYRGGRCGHFWIDPSGKHQFRRLINVDGNLACPMCVGQRIYFLSDHEGIGNLYSCRPSGSDLVRHTDHESFYARNAASDGTRIIYHAGANIYCFDPDTGESVCVPIEFHSPRTQRNRKFVKADKFLETYQLHPEGHSVALTARGKPFTLGNFEGPVVQVGEPDGVRYRLASWLHDGERIVTISDEDGEERLSVFKTLGGPPLQKLPDLDIGRAVDMITSPASDHAVLHNHRGELILVDLQREEKKLLDRSQHGRLTGVVFSPDGKWVAYSIPNSAQTTIIRLHHISARRPHDVTRPILRDISPCFDPDGKYLYFLSHRVFDPVYDNLHFDLNFPRGMRPYLATLRKDLPSPFLPGPRPLKATERRNQSQGNTDNDVKVPLKIDVDGIANRIMAFPVDEARYNQIQGLPNGRVLFSSTAIEGSLGGNRREGDPAKTTLVCFDLNSLKQEKWLGNISSFDASADGKTLIVQSGRRLRIVGATEKPKAEPADKKPGRESGWLNLDRLKISVNPPQEWRQMYREAWRLLRDNFWTADMSGVAWNQVYERYLPLLDRVASRSEFSDLIWEMQGELGTSHAYEVGGDYRSHPKYEQGFLAADFAFNSRRGGYVVTHVAQGDAWEEGAGSPLHTPGVNIKKGDLLAAIGGRELGKHVTPHELLVNQADTEVLLAVKQGRGTPRTVVVKTIKDETPVRYREWVEQNRGHVHSATKERVGYVHIPNMGPRGYAEFHRYYLTEVAYDALIVDVRYNGGGHVSQLILEKLLRRRIGYDIPRWGEPIPYPADSVLGPMVALTNEMAGSDGDVFSHCFKLLELGPLIGKRTWGGVIGIWPRHQLVDGSVTTQPEFSFWFEDVGWSVENHGTNPDIDVDITPQDDAAGNDPQLERAIAEVKHLLRVKRPRVPSFDKRPMLSLPTLPPNKRQRH